MFISKEIAMKNIKNIFIFFILSFTSFTIFAGISDGMKETLPLDHLEKNYFLEFDNYRDRPRAPIAAGININGKPVRSIQEIFTVFSEKVFAHLPEGQTIKSSLNTDNKEVWRYPIGTQVVHRITLNDDLDTVFELRMIERVNNKKWAFGVYHEENNQYKLQNCHRNTTSAPHQYENLQDVGPCEFTAQNPKVKNEWVQAFTQNQGYSPISVQN